MYDEQSSLNGKKNIGIDFTNTPASSPNKGLVIFWLLAILASLALGILITRTSNALYIALLVIGSLMALVIFMRPELGLFILIFISYTRFSDVMIQYHGFPSIAKAMVALLVVTIAVRWLTLGEKPVGWQRAFWLLGLYGFVTFLSLFYAKDFNLAQNRFMDYLDDALIALLIIILIQRGNFRRNVIWALLAAGIFLGSISVYQFITGQYDNDFFGFGMAPQMNIVGQIEDSRISGPFGSPNAYAQIMVVLVPLAIDRLINERSRLLKCIAGGALLLVVLTILFTYSRGGFIALAVVTLFTIIQYRPPLPWLLVVATGGLFALTLLPSNYVDRISTLFEFFPSSSNTVTDVSFRGRTSEYLIGYLMFADHPILGVGVDNYPEEYLAYSREVGIDPRGEKRAPHSLYIQIAAEQGLVGLTVFAVILLNLYLSSNRARSLFHSANLDGDEKMVLALNLSLIGYLTSALFVHASFPRPLWLLVGIFLALPALAQAELAKRSK